jgi:1-pyrroline-5-carboxylate dehydrogenase
VTALDLALAEVRAAAYDVHNLIGGEEVRTERLMPVVTPHAHAVILGQVHRAGPAETTAAIEAALAASSSWGRLTPEERTMPFLRAADLLQQSPWRERLVAATMLELSKTLVQAEGDVIAETADLIRANVANFLAVADVQPSSSDGVRNHLDYRPLEGFVLAVSPFNYASMNHLALGPALLGNVVVWKPAEATALVSHLMLSLLREAGLPDRVINLVHGDGAEIGGVALAHRDLAAVHFTGSTATFRHLFRAVGANVDRYRSYPRVVGETGGKGFVLAHASADLEALTEAVVDGAFDYQGQKCSAASRLYIPRSVWSALRDRLVARTEALTVGDPTVPGTDLGAVITARQFAKHADALARARAEGLVLTGGSADDRVAGSCVRPCCRLRTRSRGR